MLLKLHDVMQQTIWVSSENICVIFPSPLGPNPGVKIISAGVVIPVQEAEAYRVIGEINGQRPDLESALVVQES